MEDAESGSHLNLAIGGVGLVASVRLGALAVVHEGEVVAVVLHGRAWARLLARRPVSVRVVRARAGIVVRKARARGDHLGDTHGAVARRVVTEAVGAVFGVKPLRGTERSGGERQQWIMRKDHPIGRAVSS